jgi:hypothetical protein
MVVAVLVALMLLGALTAYALLSARSELKDGVAELHLAEKQAGSLGAVRRDPVGTIAIVRFRVSRAAADFSAARRRLDPLAPLLEHLSWVPRLGGKMAAAPQAARTADAATAGAQSLLEGIAPISGSFANTKSARHIAPAAVIRQIAAERPAFSQACALFNQASRDRRKIPATSDATVRSALATFDRYLPRLKAACLGLQVLPRILGYPRARTYLVAYQDPLELRATGGYIGSLGILTVHNAHIKQRFSGSNFLSEGQVLGARENLSWGTPEPMRLYNDEAYWFFRDSNWSPDFPTTAQVEENFIRRDLGVHVDGVLNIVPAAAADLLRVTGPIYMSAYRKWVSASNVFQLADHYTHITTAEFKRENGPIFFGPHKRGDADTLRKQFIGIVGQQALKILSHPTASMIGHFGDLLSSAFAQKDFLLYFPNAAEESLVRRVGASGEINPTTNDYLYVVDTNLSYNKYNPYMHLSTTDAVTIRRDRWLDVRLTMRFQNVPPPPSYAPRGYGPGGGAFGQWNDYATYLRILAPAGAQLVDQTGWSQAWSPGPAYGKEEFAGYLIVQHGTTRVVRLHYVVPPNVFSSTRGRKYRLLVQRQPGSHPDQFSLSVTWDGGARKTAIVRSPSRDWSVTVRIPRRPFAPIPLSRTPPVVVAPGHWLEPHAYIGPPI